MKLKIEKRETEVVVKKLAPVAVLELNREEVRYLRGLLGNIDEATFGNIVRLSAVGRPDDSQSSVAARGLTEGALEAWYRMEPMSES